MQLVEGPALCCRVRERIEAHTPRGALAMGDLLGCALEGLGARHSEVASIVLQVGIASNRRDIDAGGCRHGSLQQRAHGAAQWWLERAEALRKERDRPCVALQ